MKVEENRRLELHDMLSYRRKINSLDINSDIKDIKEKYKDAIDSSENLMVTITHSFNNDNINPELEYEVLFPIVKGKEVPEPFVLKESFVMEKAIYGGVVNDFTEVKDVVNTLSKIAIDNNIKVGMNVWVQYTKEKDSFLDLYVEIIE